MVGTCPIIEDLFINSRANFAFFGHYFDYNTKTAVAQQASKEVETSLVSDFSPLYFYYANVFLWACLYFTLLDFYHKNVCLSFCTVTLACYGALWESLIVSWFLIHVWFTNCKNKSHQSLSLWRFDIFEKYFFPFLFWLQNKGGFAIFGLKNCEFPAEMAPKFKCKFGNTEPDRLS